ncbi:alpha/beta hydrolase [Sphingomonas lutea]|uniref:Alpha/beta hydrolase n=1 Tax=Sphingomonas lutea TaxID=1045317 RepID=A0A7G9SFT1_9SPHN|nr:alpha/beta hydrolase [Sphingomonas lutea]QNN66706.1 alpha/beta hydrolase [Sphingomonas lutea]
MGAALLLAMFEFQSHLIFPTHAVPKAGRLPTGAKTLSLKVDKGVTLNGVHFPPPRASQDTTLILGFGGNAWNAQDVGTYLHDLYPGAHVVTFHYRGYAPSTGSPSSSALLADAPRLYDHAVDAIRPDRTILVGFSIGSGIAAHLATQRPVAGAILVTPFDSLKASAQSLYPWIPIGPFFAHEIDAAAAAERTSVPIAIIGAQHDTIIQPARTDALRKRVRNLVFDRTIRGAGHNDIYAKSEFQEAMQDALAAIP